MAKSFKKDMTGMRFGRITVIKFVPDNTKRSSWLCKCDCGNFKVIRAHNLVSGTTNSCGCLAKELLQESHDKRSYIHKSEYLNKKINNLTILEIKKGHNCTLCVCKCDCGNIVEKIMSAVVKGDVKSCGCLKEKTLENLKNKAHLSKDTVAFNAFYGRYFRSAKNRKIEFDLSKEQFKEVSDRKCSYCGSPPEEKSGVRTGEVYISNGINRIDNNIGYIENNIISSCYMCNKMKHTHDVNSFLLQVKKIYENLDLSRDESEISYELIKDKS